MNRQSPPRSPEPPRVDERDWRAQERALAQPSGDRRDALLAQALRTLPVSQPPPGFAAEVARRAAAGARAAGAAGADDARLERGLLNVLLAVLALASLGAVGWYGAGWWTQAQGALGGGAAQWALVGLACLLLSWLPEAARRLARAGREPTLA